MKKEEFVKTVVAYGICSKGIAERYARSKPYNYDFDGYEDFKEVSRLYESVYKAAHIIVNHFAGRYNYD